MGGRIGRGLPLQGFDGGVFRIGIFGGDNIAFLVTDQALCVLRIRPGSSFVIVGADNELIGHFLDEFRRTAFFHRLIQLTLDHDVDHFAVFDLAFCGFLFGIGLFQALEGVFNLFFGDFFFDIILADGAVIAEVNSGLQRDDQGEFRADDIFGG